MFIKLGNKVYQFRGN